MSFHVVSKPVGRTRTLLQTDQAWPSEGLSSPVLFFAPAHQFPHVATEGSSLEPLNHWNSLSPGCGKPQEEPPGAQGVLGGSHEPLGLRGGPVHGGSLLRGDWGSSGVICLVLFPEVLFVDPNFKIYVFTLNCKL